MLPPERRLGEMLELIHRRNYFATTAPQRTGKTTSLLWLEKHLNETRDWRAVYVDVEHARDEHDPMRAFRVLVQNLGKACATRHPDIRIPNVEDIERDPMRAISDFLVHIAAQDNRPWCILFDKIDALTSQAREPFFQCLRDGYLHGKHPFPASIGVATSWHVRHDHAPRVDHEPSIIYLGRSSPFHVVTAEAMTLGPFTASEVEELLVQHTTATGQRFEPEAIALIYELGQGHPWLTNAMADQIVRKDVKDRSVPITAAHVEAAKETIILERRTHIDSLVARLREERVRRIIDPMMSGARTGHDVLHDDFAYVLGLGLIRPWRGQYRIANPIYREVIPRALNYDRQMQIANEPLWYVRKDGSLDMAKLMADWQKFWRQDGHLAAEGFGYRESGPHLMLMAFLQRVINGGGRIDREYGLGRGALDLLITWQKDRHAIEVKLRRDRETEEEALDQVAGYLDRLGLDEGWLVFFDLRQGPTWAERLYQREVEHAGKRIRIVGG